jgi:hypothetical protein
MNPPPVAIRFVRDYVSNVGGRVLHAKGAVVILPPRVADAFVVAGYAEVVE